MKYFAMLACTAALLASCGSSNLEEIQTSPFQPAAESKPIAEILSEPGWNKVNSGVWHREADGIHDWLYLGVPGAQYMLESLNNEIRTSGSRLTKQQVTSVNSFITDINVYLSKPHSSNMVSQAITGCTASGNVVFRSGGGLTSSGSVGCSGSTNAYSFRGWALTYSDQAQGADDLKVGAPGTSVNVYSSAYGTTGCYGKLLNTASNANEDWYGRNTYSTKCK